MKTESKTYANTIWFLTFQITRTRKYLLVRITSRLEIDDTGLAAGLVQDLHPAALIRPSTSPLIKPKDVVCQITEALKKKYNICLRIPDIYVY